MTSKKFKKNKRILKRSHFQKIISNGKKNSGNYIYLYYRLNHTSMSKIGITASSYFGKAIERNLFKRRIREIFRQNFLNKGTKKSFEIIVLAKKAAKKTPYNKLKDECLSLLKEIID